MTLEVRFSHAFKDFDLNIAFGINQPGVTALFGPSGSGKTTCVNVIAGLLRPDNGIVRIADRTVLDTASGVDLAARKRRVGYVFQDARLFPHMSVAKNLKFGARRARTALSEAEISSLIRTLGIAHLLDRAPGTLSGGERQRVSLGRALMTNPDILLLDEPLAALDQGRKAEILPYLENMADEARIPIVLVSHSIDEVTRLASEMVLLSDGKTAASGPVTQIMSRIDLFPLTGRFEAGAVIEGTLADHDDAYGMSRVTLAASNIMVPRVRAEPGDKVRLRVRARDVMLATRRPSNISANIVLKSTVEDLRVDAGAYVDIRLDCNGTPLLARITQLSRERLGIEPGSAVWAIVKSVSVERTGGNVRQDATDQDVVR